MGKLYRVTVVEVGEEQDDVLFEISAGAAIVAKVAPGAVAEALGVAGSVDVRVEPSMGYMTPDGPVATAEAPATPGRKRRTKAEIEAARAAEAAEAAEKLAAPLKSAEEASKKLVEPIADTPAPATPAEQVDAPAPAAAWNPFIAGGASTK